jgi:hypothetical protein
VFVIGADVMACGVVVLEGRLGTSFLVKGRGGGVVVSRDKAVDECVECSVL